MEVTDNEITLVVFKGEFMEWYFPEDVHGEKQIEFLELKQGNSTVAKYAARFEGLVKCFPHYNGATAKASKFIMFENGLRSKIKQGIRLVNFRNW